MKDLSPPALDLKQIVAEGDCREPILILTSAGSDPSTELRELATATVTLAKFKVVWRM